MIILAQVISTLSQILYWLVIISVILSYFMDPFHPLRRGIDNIVEPMLNPIRRVVPPMGGFDFSPIGIDRIDSNHIQPYHSYDNLR